MEPVLVAAFVVHVVSAALWTGSALYVALAVVPAARGGDLSAAGFEWQIDGLLQVTRWTGLALPATGVYQAWQLYPLSRLLGTPRGHLVVVMAALWGAMNGLIEVGAYRMRGDAATGPARHVVQRFAVPAGADVATLVARGRPYLRAAAALAVLLLVDAALLAGGVGA